MALLNPPQEFDDEAHVKARIGALLLAEGLWNLRAIAAANGKKMAVQVIPGGDGDAR